MVAERASYGARDHTLRLTPPEIAWKLDHIVY
jgi:hypothetical protein